MIRADGSKQAQKNSLKLAFWILWKSEAGIIEALNTVSAAIATVHFWLCAVHGVLFGAVLGAALRGALS